LRVFGFSGGEAFGVRRGAGRRGGAAFRRVFIRAVGRGLVNGQPNAYVDAPPDVRRWG